LGGGAAPVLPGIQQGQRQLNVNPAQSAPDRQILGTEIQAGDIFQDANGFMIAQ
jgi:hypothetical protein